MTLATKGRWHPGKGNGMEIEFVEFAAEAAMHRHHAEIVVITTTEEPLGPGEWAKVWESLDPGRQETLAQATGAGLRATACKFDVDTEHEMDPETTGYVQWWAFPKK